MKLATSRMFSTILLTVLSAGLMNGVMGGGPRDGHNSAAQSKDTAAKRSADDRASLANGVYAVLREGLTREAAQPGPVPHVTLLYDRKYSESDRKELPKYVALDTSSFVPLVLAGPPETGKDDRGRTLLRATLAPEHVKTLEAFTRVHLGAKVAIVIDGEIITMHKVRAVIEGGRVQISRCQDDACQVLRLKLTK